MPAMPTLWSAWCTAETRASRLLPDAEGPVPDLLHPFLRPILDLWHAAVRLPLLILSLRCARLWPGTTGLVFLLFHVEIRQQGLADDGRAHRIHALGPRGGLCSRAAALGLCVVLAHVRIERLKELGDSRRQERGVLQGCWGDARRGIASPSSRRLRSSGRGHCSLAAQSWRRRGGNTLAKFRCQCRRLGHLRRHGCWRSSRCGRALRGHTARRRSRTCFFRCRWRNFRGGVASLHPKGHHRRSRRNLRGLFLLLFCTTSAALQQWLHGITVHHLGHSGVQRLELRCARHHVSVCLLHNTVVEGMEVLPVGYRADIGFAQQKLLQCLDLFLCCHDVRIRLHVQSLVQDSDGGAGGNILLPHLNALIGGYIACICFPLRFFLELLEFFLARHLCEKTSKLCAAVDGLCICLLIHNPLQILKCVHLDGAAVDSDELGHARHIPAVGLVLQVRGQNLKLRQGWRVLAFSLVLEHAVQELHF
mmetsp:Transcript_53332/g.125079  ORF Transcript_53332/g.125079 Transcript_53332/m.125079 type:complete len:478 (+) Transcript_53332:93-1526(+)